MLLSAMIREFVKFMDGVKGGGINLINLIKTTKDHKQGLYDSINFFHYAT